MVASHVVNNMLPTTSREKELDADRFAFRLAAAAGYNPEAGIAVMTRLSAIENADEYNRTHPPGAVR